jgi:hypothetical protein
VNELLKEPKVIEGIKNLFEVIDEKIAYKVLEKNIIT